MRIRKTNQKDRGIYKYTTTELTKNGEYVEKTVVIKPGEDGVTELDIKMLHSLDDSEVYYNLKNARPERRKEEKAEIEVWKQKFISDFTERHGYEPNKYIIEDAVKDAFPRDYNLSLDFDADGDIDPDKRLIRHDVQLRRQEPRRPRAAARSPRHDTQSCLLGRARRRGDRRQRSDRQQAAGPGTARRRRDRSGRAAGTGSLDRLLIPLDVRHGRSGGAPGRLDR